MSDSSHDEKVVSAASGAVPPVATKAGDVPPTYAIATQEGISKVKAAKRVWGPKSKIALWIGVALASYIYSLDGTTTYQYQALATSSFAAHSLLGAIGVAQAIVLATMKPVAAKLSDVFGRAEAYLFAVVFYVLGYIVIASSKTVNTYAGGAILYEVGYASLQILLQIVIGDVTSLRWRGIVSSSVSLPFFINAFVSSNIAQGILQRSGWRWGYGMFAILIPVTVGPIIGVLAWAQFRAKKLGVVATNYQDGEDAKLESHKDVPIGSLIYNHIIDLDALGLLLFAAGWTCLLLPLTLVNRSTTTWSSKHIIAMLVVGPIILIGFIVYEGKFARKPVFPLRFFKNKTIVACSLIAFFDFVSFYLQFTFQYSFIAVTHSDWSIKNQGYFAYTQTLCLTFFAVVAGFIQFATRRTKWLLTIGLCIRLLGIGLMIKSRGAHGSTGFLVITQVIQGAGGGIAACASQLLAQGSVPHQDFSTVTAFYLLFAEIGNAVGSAIASAIWRDHMPQNLNNNLQGLLNSTQIEAIYGSITTAASYPRTSAVYQGVVKAYGDTMKVLLIAGTCIAVIPIALSFLVNDLYLGDTQNAVEAEEGSGGGDDEKNLSKA
ncbi:drug:h+ antiporter [Meredithblackwellia eburnea MCA 4105]